MARIETASYASLAVLVLGLVVGPPLLYACALIALVVNGILLVRLFRTRNLNPQQPLYDTAEYKLWSRFFLLWIGISFVAALRWV